MKKIILTAMAAVALALPAMAQDGSAAQFVSDYSNFVNYMSSHRHLDKSTMQRADSIFGVYNKEFDTQYKSQMTDEQKSEYYEAKGRYEGAVLKAKGRDGVDRAEQKGRSAGQKMKKEGRKLKDKGQKLLHRADSAGSEAWGKVKRGGKKAVAKTDTIGVRTGEAIKTGYDESAAWLRGLFSK